MADPAAARSLRPAPRPGGAGEHGVAGGGRVVAALLAREPLPDGADRVLEGLERDGLVTRDERGRARIPTTRIAAADLDPVLEDPSGP